jgi:hypothetical protein
MSLFDYTGSFSGSFTGDLTSNNGVISSSAQLPFGLISSSTQVNYTNLQNKPITISVFQKNSIIANTNFREVTFPSYSQSISTELTFLESSLNTLSGQVQAAVSGTVPPGTISSSNQLFVLNIFTSSIQTQVDNLTQETSSYILVSQTSSMSVLSAVTASYISPTFISASVAAFGFGSGGGTATDITALNIFTSSIQTQVDSLIVKTGSYATTGSNIFNGNQNINGSVTSSKVLTNALKFNTSAGVSVGVGELAWNNSDGTLDLGMKGGNVVQQIGQEIFYEVRNETGIQIPNGTAVFANGVTAGSARITVAPYVADGSIREVRFLGLATENISTDVNGFVTHFGYVRGLDTRGTTASSIAVGDEDWQVGDILYVHPTVAGKLTNVPPKHEISAAIVITRHQSVGVLFVRPTSYGHLDDIHDVSINTSSLSTGDVLVYNSSSDVWENSDSVNLALTASYIDPTFISASAAAAGFGSGGSTIPAGTVSSSAQVVQNLVGQDVVVNSITAETYIISSSVSFITTSFSSGSTKFGDDLNDTHEFTGSILITGSLNINGPFTVNNENLNVSSGSIILTNSSSIVVLDSGIISGSFFGDIVVSNKNVTPPPIAGGIFYSASAFYFGIDD